MIWTITIKGQSIYNKWSITADHQDPEPRDCYGIPGFDNIQIKADSFGNTSQREFVSAGRCGPAASNRQDMWQHYGVLAYAEVIRFEGSTEDVEALIERTLGTVTYWDWEG